MPYSMLDESCTLVYRGAKLRREPLRSETLEDALAEARAVMNDCHWRPGSYDFAVLLDGEEVHRETFARTEWRTP